MRARRDAAVLRAVGLALCLAAPLGTAHGSENLAPLFQQAVGAFEAGRYGEARERFSALAEEAHPESHYNLGVLYEQGHGVTEDYARALEHYRAAAERQVPEAQYNLGLMYQEGQGVPQDRSAAAEWFRAAAEQGHEPAMTNLAALYERGLGVPRDAARARDWYRRAGAWDPSEATRRHALEELQVSSPSAVITSLE